MRSRGAAAGLESWAPRRAKPPPPPARRPPIAARGSAERSVYAPLIWIRSRGGCLQRRLLPSRWSAAPRRRCRNSCRTFEWRFRSGRQVWVWGGAADVQLLDHNVLVWRAAAAAAGTACTCGARRSGGKQTAATRKTKPAGRNAEKTFRFSSRDDAADVEKRKIQTVSGKC